MVLCVEEAIVKLESNMQEMIHLLHTLYNQSLSQAPTHGTSFQTTSQCHVSPIHELLSSPPEVFKGEPDQCHSFLTQYNIYFQLQPSSFPSEQSKVAYTISLLSGKAKLWDTAEWQRDTRYCYSFNAFPMELCWVFDPISPEREAVQRLFSLKQGEMHVTEYIIEFHYVTADSRWNEEALTDAFFQGLNDRIKDKLATKNYPGPLKNLEDLATRIYIRLVERKHEKGGRVEGVTSP